MATIPVTAALIFGALLYLRGWLRLRGAIPLWRAASFLAGIFSVWLAAASPLAMMDEHLLTAHMVQHLLLLTIGPAFILLGFPALMTPAWLAERMPRRPHPLFSLCAASAVLIGWHIPAVFALSFHSVMWHYVQHATFLVAGLLFWQPVIPARPGESHHDWPVVLYLFMATLPCDALSAFLAFNGRVVYPEYLNVPRHFGLSALQDQQCAGALMWTVVTFAYLIPAVLVTMGLLTDSTARGSLRPTVTEAEAIALRQR
jgi:cytochrome c oxidase assembly factor CtaG